MKRICNQCQTEMIEDCIFEVHGAVSVNIKKKVKGFLNSVYAVPKVAVCTNCGCVVLYIDEYKDFK